MLGTRVLQISTIFRSVGCMRILLHATLCSFTPLDGTALPMPAATSALRSNWCRFGVAGLAAEGCQAVLTSSGAEGVRAVVMDLSKDAVFVGDSCGYIHVLRLMLKKGQLQPLVLLGRVPPPGWVSILSDISASSHSHGCAAVLPRQLIMRRAPVCAITKLSAAKCLAMLASGAKPLCVSSL